MKKHKYVKDLMYEMFTKHQIIEAANNTFVDDTKRIRDRRKFPNGLSEKDYLNYVKIMHSGKKVFSSLSEMDKMRAKFSDEADKITNVRYTLLFENANEFEKCAIIYLYIYPKFRDNYR